MSDAPPPPAVAEIQSHTAAMEATIAAVEAWTTVLDGYIQRTFKPGVDFGAVEGESSTGQKFTGKPTLLKPGAEKLTLVLGLRATFVADTEAYEMAGRPAGLIAFKCLLLAAGGEVVGEGRGAASMQEKKTINLAVKFAEKRAHIDAILRHTGLSAYFEGEERQRSGTRRPPAQQQPQATPKTPRPPAPAPVPAGAATTLPAPAAISGSAVSVDPAGFPAPAGVRPEQVRQIRALLGRLGWDEAEFVAANGAVPLPEISAVRALRMIDKLEERVKDANAKGGQAA